LPSNSERNIGGAPLLEEEAAGLVDVDTELDAEGGAHAIFVDTKGSGEEVPNNEVASVLVGCAVLPLVRDLDLLLPVDDEEGFALVTCELEVGEGEDVLNPTSVGSAATASRGASERSILHG
jgi:hypothetical protein